MRGQPGSPKQPCPRKHDAAEKNARGACRACDRERNGPNVEHDNPAVAAVLIAWRAQSMSSMTRRQMAELAVAALTKEGQPCS